MTRDTDARIRSDARAREIGCFPLLAAIGIGGLLAYLFSKVVM